MDHYTLFGVNVDGTLLQGMKSHRIGTNIQKRLNINDGNSRARYVTVMMRETTITFTTNEVVAALTAVGTEGAAISSSVVLFFQKTQANGQRASGSSHVKVTVASGLIVPRRARASQGDEAEIEYEIFPISADGTTDPITIADSQALSGSPSVSQKFTVGPASFSGTSVETQSIEIDFGCDVKTKSHSGFYLPVHGYIDTIKPKLTVTTLDVGVAASIGLTGQAQTTTDSLAYFRKMDENGTRVADITAEHAKFSFDQGHYHVDDVGAQDGGDATATIIYDVTFDDSVAPVVFSAAAIT